MRKMRKKTNPPMFCGFVELDSGNNRIVLVGDTQTTSLIERLILWRENNKKKIPLLIDEIARVKPACVLHLGDLVFNSASQKQWQWFDEIHKPILENKTPYFCIPGNHEYWQRPVKAFKNYFSRFPHLDNRKWYSFTFQRIGFVMVDSNFSKLSVCETCSQIQWYSRELLRLNEDPGIDYIIVCCHQPPYTNSTIYHDVVKPGKDIQVCFVEPFLELKKTAAFFSGHCHSYEKFEKRGKYFIVCGGGGGPRQKLKTKEENRPYPDTFEGPPFRILNFCLITIEPGKLSLQVKKLTDDDTFENLDEFIIQTPIL